ncbi:hypothetical protein [Streptomyces griseofuscus]|uniref:hypothetical protein n=1 Tax=Streptomyces griseofuscus TaxID=146922 RepID=UPI0038014D6E
MESTVREWTPPCSPSTPPSGAHRWDTIDLPSLSLTLKQEPVGVWKDSAIKDTVSGGGSQSRSIPLANNIAYEYTVAFGPKHGPAFGPPKRRKAKTVTVAA